MNRKTKLEKALAFDKFAGMKNDYVEGRQFENRRLAPLHAALLEAMEALEFAYNYSNDRGVFNKAKGALAKIDKVLEEK